MNESMYKIIIGILSAAAVILTVMIFVVSVRYKKEKQGRINLFVERKDGIREVYEKIFRFLDSVPLTRRMARIYSRRFELLYPGDSKESSFLTIRLLVRILAVSAIILVGVFGMNPSLFTLVTAVVLCYIFAVEQICRNVSEQEIKFLKAFDQFLCVIRHCFYKSGSVRDALYWAIPDLEKMMKGHAEQLHTVLISSDIREATDEYMNAGYHKYLKLFLSLAEMVEENGDVTDDEGSVFLNSCMQMRNDVQEEKRYIEERRHKFAALSYTAGVPVAAVPFIADWGVNTIPSLVGFYRGHTGFLIKAVIVVTVYLCFCAIVRLREGDRLTRKTYALSAAIAELSPVRWVLSSYINRHYGKTKRTSELLKRLCEKYDVKTFFVHKILVSTVVLTVMTILMTVGHSESREILLTDVSDVSNLSTSADGKQIAAMETNIIKYTCILTGNEWQNENENGTGENRNAQIEGTNSDTANIVELVETGDILSVENREVLEKCLTELLLEERGIRTVEVAECTAREIVGRINDYNDEVFGIGDALIALLSGFLAFVYPSLSLKLRKSLSENKMQDEVMQFQSLIHILKKVPGISAMSILEEMESFSDIFKPAIRQCINEYGISEQEAFERLYDAEPYPGLRRIVDSFMLVDEMGIEDAFEEISAEIVNFKENRKLERTILLDNEGMLGTVLAVVPGGLILFGYLLCPFLIRSVQIFNSYQLELSSLAR